MTTDEPTFKGEARLSWLLRQAGFLATKGASEEGINAFLQAENRVRCSPPLEPEEIQRVVSRTVDYEKSERGLRAVSIDEFRTAEERRARYALIDDEAITRLPSPRWTIDGILPEKGRSLWHAPPGRGKTFALLAAAFAIAAGTPWFGRDVEQGPVIYVAAEGGPAMGQRVRAWKVRHGVEGQVGVYFLLRPVPLLEPDEVSAFLEQAIRLGPVRQVFIDTWARALVGGEEESSRDVGLAIAAVDRIGTALDAGVGVIHHPTKRQEHIERGSGALKGAMDTVVRFGKDGDGFKLICEKQKDAEPFPELRGRLEVVQLADGSTSCVAVHVPGPVVALQPQSDPLVLSSKQREALAVLANQPGGQSGPKQWEKAAGIKNREVYRAREALLKAGYVEPVPGGLKSVYHLTTQGKQYLEGTVTVT